MNFNNNWHAKIPVALWKSSRRFHMTSFWRTLLLIANKNIAWLRTVLPVHFFFRITALRICKNLGNIHARSAHNYAQGCKRRCHRLLVLLLLDIINTSYLYKLHPKPFALSRKPPPIMLLSGAKWQLRFLSYMLLCLRNAKWGRRLVL